MADLTKQATAEVRAQYAQRLRDVKAQLSAQTPVAVNETLPGKNPVKRKSIKISAQDALAGISAAIQGEEKAAQPDVQAAMETPLPGDAYAVGQRVRVVTDDEKLGFIARKWAGKEGTITRREAGGGYWDVTFRGRNGGIAMFADDQLEELA